MWNFNTKAIPVAIGALGMIEKEVLATLSGKLKLEENKKLIMSKVLSM